MPNVTPGEVCFAMYQRRLHNLTASSPLDYPRPFATLSAAQRAAWEAAAQAAITAWIASPDWPTPAPQEEHHA